MSQPHDELVLAVDDIDAARDELIGRGVEVSGVFPSTRIRVPFPAGTPRAAPTSTVPRSRDPDGNTWHLQEITERPGRD